MKVLYIEDEVKTVQSLKKGLEENDIMVDFAYDGITGLQMVKNKPYDIIISDIVMPGMNGLMLVKEIRALGIQTPILLLTALDSTDSKVDGFEVGADDYLAKPFAFRELLARVRALVRRNKEVTQPNQVLTFLDIELDTKSRICKRGGVEIVLTPREYSLLAYLIQHQGRVISKIEIAEKVWDLHFDTSTNVVEVYVNYLRNKVDKHFHPNVIHTVFGVGYILKVK